MEGDLLHVNQSTQALMGRIKESVQQTSKPPHYLTCPVCLDLYERPKVLPCSHTICASCLDSIAGANPVYTRQDRNAMMSCPVCRERVKKSQLGSLPSNRALEDVLCDWESRMMQTRLQNIASIIAKCANHNLNKNYHCETCNIYVCAECKNGPLHAKHTILIDNYYEKLILPKAHVLNECFSGYCKAEEIPNKMCVTTRKHVDMIQNHLKWVEDINEIENQVFDLITLKFAALRADVNLQYAMAVKPLQENNNYGLNILQSLNNFLFDVSNTPEVETKELKKFNTELLQQADAFEKDREHIKRGENDFKRLLEESLSTGQEFCNSLHEWSMIGNRIMPLFPSPIYYHSISSPDHEGAATLQEGVNIDADQGVPGGPPDRNASGRSNSTSPNEAQLPTAVVVPSGAPVTVSTNRSGSNIQEHWQNQSTSTALRIPPRHLPPHAVPVVVSQRHSTMTQVQPTYILTSRGFQYNLSAAPPQRMSRLPIFSQPQFIHRPSYSPPQPSAININGRQHFMVPTQPPQNGLYVPERPQLRASRRLRDNNESMALNGATSATSSDTNLPSSSLQQDAQSDEFSRHVSPSGSLSASPSSSGIPFQLQNFVQQQSINVRTPSAESNLQAPSSPNRPEMLINQAQRYGVFDASVDSGMQGLNSYRYSSIGQNESVGRVASSSGLGSVSSNSNSPSVLHDTAITSAGEQTLDTNQNNVNNSESDDSITDHMDPMWYQSQIQNREQIPFVGIQNSQSSEPNENMVSGALQIDIHPTGEISPDYESSGEE